MCLLKPCLFLFSVLCNFYLIFSLPSRCAPDTDSYTIVTKKRTANVTSESLLGDNLSSSFSEKLKDPILVASWLLSFVMFWTIIALTVGICRIRYRRPRIKKRIIVNKNVTPLTYRPGQNTEQCEITIENCCNMNICETVRILISFLVTSWAHSSSLINFNCNC